MKYTLHTIANRLTPSGPVELEGERILCNNIILPGEFNPHRIRLWVIGNEYGPLCAVWADCEQDAFDEATDAGMLDSFIVSPEDYEAMNDDEKENCAHLGNAGELANLDYAWVAEVEFKPERDLSLLLAFARADGARSNTLDQ
jgi:alpha-L-arabinofuranosidase